MSVRYIRYKPFPNQLEAQVLFGNILHNYWQTPQSSCPPSELLATPSELPTAPSELLADPSELLAENSEVSLALPSNKSPAKTKGLKLGTSYRLRS